MYFGDIMKVFFHTLGCKVNQYETQEMREQLKKNGYEVTDDETATHFKTEFSARYNVALLHSMLDLYR